MNTTLRRQDRKISDDEALAILQQGEYGVLSMCTPKDGGYGIPLNYAFVNHALYFHCALEGSKMEYLKSNNKASFCVVGKTEVMPAKFGTLYESVIAFGNVTHVDELEKRAALMKLIEKYSPGYIKEGNDYIEKLFSRTLIIKLTVEAITGKARRQ
jgi:uncharacterized protein